MVTNRSRKQVRESRVFDLALTPKAVRYFEKRPHGPGEYGRTCRRQDSDYVARLKEKQRLRVQYGIREPRLCRAFEEARHIVGLTGGNLAELLEVCLNSLVLRAGFARTIQQARQFVVHHHIPVDGKTVDRPSSHVKPGQILQVKPKSQTTVSFEVVAGGIHWDVLPVVPEYPDVELSRLKVILVRRPKRAEVPVTIDIQMVAEHYSR